MISGDAVQCLRAVSSVKGERSLSGKNLRLAVVGLGKMGLVHAGVLNVLPSSHVVALCEKSKLIRKFAVKVFKGLEIVDDVMKLSGLDLDAVYVTTPIPSHFAVGKTVLQKGIAHHIFVEKTLAYSYEQSKQLAELAGAQGCVNMVGYLRRFYVTFRKARELIMGDAIGEVDSFKACAYSSDFLGTERGPGRPASRGGVLRDLGCHAIDLALWFFGDLETRSAKSSVKDGFTCDDLNFKVAASQLTGEFDVSWLKANYRLPEVWFSVSGSKGGLDVNDDVVKLRLKSGESITWYRHDLKDNVPFLLGLPEYYREDLSFLRSIIEGRKTEPDFLAASKVDKMIEEVEKKAGGRN